MSIDAEIGALLARAAEHDIAGDLDAAADVLGWARQQLDGACADAVTDPLLTAVVTWRHADVLHRSGAIDTAHQLARHLVDDLVVAYGPRHPAALRATGVLARILHAQGRLDDADRLYVVVLGAADDDELAGWAVRLARADRAQLIADRGHPQRAAPLLAAAVTALHGPTRQHLAVAVRYSLDLAALYGRLADPGAAVEVLDDAAAKMRRVFGPEHPLTARVETALIAYTAPAGSPVPDRPGPATPTSPSDRAAGSPAPTRRSARAPLPRRLPRRTGRRLVAVAVAVFVTIIAAAGVESVRWAMVGSDPRPRDAATTAVDPTVTLSSATAAPAPVPTLEPGPPQQVRLVRNPPTTLTVAWHDPTGSSPALLHLTRAGGGAVTDTTTPAGTTEHRFTGLRRTTGYCVRIALVYSTALTVAAAPACTQPHTSASPVTYSAAATQATHRTSGAHRRQPPRCAPWPVAVRRRRRHPIGTGPAMTGTSCARPAPGAAVEPGRHHPTATASGTRPATSRFRPAQPGEVDTSEVLHPPDRAAVWRDLLP